MKSGLPSVQIVKAAPELYSFACRWYVSSSSWVTLLLAPPFWFVVQFVPVGVGAGADVVGAGGVLGDGLAEPDEADGLGRALVDVLGDGADGERGRRLGRALVGRLDDEDGPVSGLVDESWPDWATHWSRTELAGQFGALTDTPVSFPDARQA